MRGSCPRAYPFPCSCSSSSCARARMITLGFFLDPVAADDSAPVRGPFGPAFIVGGSLGSCGQYFLRCIGACSHVREGTRFSPLTANTKHHAGVRAELEANLCRWPSELTMCHETSLETESRSSARSLTFYICKVFVEMALNWHVKMITPTQIYKFSANNLECNKVHVLPL